MSRHTYHGYEYEGSNICTAKLEESTPDSLIIAIAEQIVPQGDGIPRLKELIVNFEHLIDRRERGVARGVAKKLES